MNTLNTFNTQIFTKTPIPLPSYPAPASSTIISTSTTLIVVSFALVSGAPGYTATAANGGTSYSVSGTTSPLTITGIPAAATPLQYTVTVKCSGIGIDGVYSALTTTPILTYMISSGMVGNLALTQGSTITYSSNGRTGVNGTNTSSVQSGTAYIDRANGLTIGSGSSINATYMNLPNLNNTFFQSKNVTFYMKYKLVNTTSNSRVFTFCNSFSSGVDNFANLALRNSATSFNFAYYENSQVFDGGTGTNTGGIIYHLFFVFSTANTQVMTLYKDSETTAQFTGSGNTSSSSVFSNYLLFTIAREMFSTINTCSLILYYANVLPVALTTPQMQNIATGSLVV